MPIAGGMDIGTKVGASLIMFVFLLQDFVERYGKKNGSELLPSSSQQLGAASKVRIPKVGHRAFDTCTIRMTLPLARLL